MFKINLEDREQLEELCEILYDVDFNSTNRNTLCSFLGCLVTINADKEVFDRGGLQREYSGTIDFIYKKIQVQFRIEDGISNGTVLLDWEITKQGEEVARPSYDTLKRFEGTYCEEFPNSKVCFKENPEFNKTTEEKKMRRVVTVKLIDPSTSIEADMALVADFGEYVTDDSNEVLIQEILMEGWVFEPLGMHNEVRDELFDKDILKNTGQKVNLEPVRLKDLKWIIKE